MIKDRGGQTLAYVYFEEEPGRVSGIACCGGGLASALTGECVGAVVLSRNARAKTHARLTRNARVRADPTRILSTNDTSLRTPLKRKHLFQVVDHDHPPLGRIYRNPGGVWHRWTKRMPLALAHHSSAFRLASSRVSASNIFSIGQLASAFLSVEIATSGFAFPPASQWRGQSTASPLGPPSARNCRLSTGSGEGRERILRSPVS